MSNLLSEFESKQKETLKKEYPDFYVGDTVVVHVNIGERTQAYEGVCIAIKNRGLNSCFTVRKISSGFGVERVFPFYSPNVESIDVKKHGRVKRSKLYYLRKLTGKAARIKEATTGYKVKNK